jgi:uncharacterized protein (TIGR02996 family)
VRAYRQVQRINLRLQLVNVDPVVQQPMTASRFEEFMDFVQFDDILAAERTRSAVPLGSEEAVRQSFLQAILDDPEADTPRLIFADWLEEHGDPRGEFIHLQYRLEREPNHPHRGEWAEREADLCDKHAHAWVGPLVPVVEEPIFRRGFLEEAELRAEYFLDNSGYLFEHAPIRRLHFCRVRPGEMPLLAASAALERLIGLSFPHANLRGADFLAFAASPNLGRLAALDLSSNHLGVEGATALATLTAPLRELDLRRTHLAGPALAELLPSALMVGLTHLDLAGNGLDDAAVALLAQSPTAAGLKRLDLRANRITDAGAEALLTSPHLARGMELRLFDNPGISPAYRRRLRTRFGACVEV